MATSKSVLHALPEGARLLFSVLSRAPGIDRFVLVGGTALALRLQHRVSEDLDFMMPDKLDRPAILSVLQHLHGQRLKLTKLVHAATALQFDMEGEDADDYSQDWRVSEVKLTFFARKFDTPEAQARLKNVLRSEPVAALPEIGVRVASEDCIFSLKSHVISERLVSRDLFDLRTLIETRGYTLDRMFEEAAALGASPAFIKERLIAGRLRQDDPGVQLLDGSVVDPQGLRAWFGERIDELERAQAEAARNRP